MRPALLAAAVLLALPLLPAAALPVPTSHTVVLAAGTVHHTYVTQGTCEADARAVVTYDTLYRRATVRSDTPCILGYYSNFLECQGGLGQRIACLQEGPTSHVHMVLEPDGGLDLVWTVEGHFHEHITGRLVRAG